MKFTSIATFATFLVMAAASPSSSPRDTGAVFAPTILAPKEGSLWTVGTRQSISWDLTEVPANFNTPGILRLIKGGVTTPIILASGFGVQQGVVQIIVPDLVDGTDYQVALFDSVDASSVFNIHGSGVAA